jgi:hypothetical protein
MRLQPMIPFRALILASALAAPVLTLSAAGPAAAHHSFAMYDATKLVTITGTVKEFQWTNPHAILWVYTDPKNGKPELWSFELSTSPGPLSRLGWTKNSLKPGDKVAVEMNPLHDGEHGGSLKKATVLATGQVLTTTAPIVQASAN